MTTRVFVPVCVAPDNMRKQAVSVPMMLTHPHTAGIAACWTVLVCSTHSDSFGTLRFCRILPQDPGCGQCDVLSMLTLGSVNKGQITLFSLVVDSWAEEKGLVCMKPCPVSRGRLQEFYLTPSETKWFSSAQSPFKSGASEVASKSSWVTPEMPLRRGLFRSGGAEGTWGMLQPQTREHGRCLVQTLGSIPGQHVNLLCLCFPGVDTFCFGLSFHTTTLTLCLLATRSPNHGRFLVLICWSVKLIW